MEGMPDLMAPFVPWVKRNFFDALRMYGHMSLEKDGTRVVAALREGGNLRMWFLEAEAAE